MNMHDEIMDICSAMGLSLQEHVIGDKWGRRPYRTYYTLLFGNSNEVFYGFERWRLRGPHHHE